MRRSLIATSLASLVVLLGGVSLSVAANPNCVAPASPNCVAKPRCRCPSCCDTPCRPDEPLTPRNGPPTNPPREAPPEQELVETGVYVAPPRTGAMIGPSSRVGIEGFSVTLPALKLTSPRIEFPHLFRSRSEARMVVEEAHAPYVATGYQYAHQGAAPGQRAAPRQAPPDDCEEQLRVMKEKYDQLERQAAQLERALEQQQQRGGSRDGAPRGEKEPCLSPPQPEVDAMRLNLRPLPMVRTAPVEVGATAGYAHRPVGYLQEPALIPRHVEVTASPAPGNHAVRRLPAVR